jgi:hypothetical protein
VSRFVKNVKVKQVRPEIINRERKQVVVFAETKLDNTRTGGGKRYSECIVSERLHKYHPESAAPAFFHRTHNKKPAQETRGLQGHLQDLAGGMRV